MKVVASLTEICLAFSQVNCEGSSRQLFLNGLALFESKYFIIVGNGFLLVSDIVLNKLRELPYFLLLK
jgi:hypothetical protein